MNTATDSKPYQVHFLGEPYNDYWGGAFLMDQWQITDRFQLEGQLRGDWYSQTQTDWSARASALYSLDNEKNHVLRLSGAKAFRAPLDAQRNASATTVGLPTPPFPPGLYVVNLIPPGDLKNEETRSLEFGYSGRFSRVFSGSVNTYYQRFDRLIGYNLGPDPYNLNRLFITPRNIDGADTYGGECELSAENKMGKITGWYAYNAIATDQVHQDTRSYLPATHKTGVNGRIFLPQDITFNANYRFASMTQSSDQTFAHNVTRGNILDLTISKKVFRNGEVMFGVLDVLNNDHAPVNYFGAFTSHETPGRTLFARFQVTF